MKLTELYEGDVVTYDKFKKYRDKKAAIRNRNEPDYNTELDSLEFVPDGNLQMNCAICHNPYDECECIAYDMDDSLEESIIVESAKMAWARKGKKIVRKYRCVTGKRKGRIVSNPSQCSKPIDMKKRRTLKKTKARLGGKMARKARKTKRINPASKRLTKLNRR